jgi:hypothetical protein
MLESDSQPTWFYISSYWATSPDELSGRAGARRAGVESPPQPTRAVRAIAEVKAVNRERISWMCGFPKRITPGLVTRA